MSAGDATAERDELLGFRGEFPALERSVYMVSHSLGAMPRRTQAHLAEFASLWVERGINAWEQWLPEVDRAAERVGRIINAPAGTMVMATNVSQIQALIASCLDYAGARNRVVYSELEFPSVSYVWQEERRRGADVVVVPSDDGVRVPTERMLDAIDERTLVVPISHVLFRSSALQDARAITRRAHEVGAMVVLDCYQSTGTVPVDVTALDVDFACGGSVKWLCGGPGAGYLYVRPDRVKQFSPRTTGWFGHEKPFAFTMPEQRFADGVWRYMAGTPAVAALYQARAGAELIGEIGVERIRKKSLRQTARVIELCDAAGYRLNTPRAAGERGGTVCFDFDGPTSSDRVAKALNATGFLCDHRPQAGIRMSPHFYSTDEEVERFMAEVARLRSVR
ncbi:MAG TPA: aminotransferase class V-fold PLP-dependent enzyme [Polyangia bacterium]|nr:aminotransferase class V-fold PLP-dependent enzyme [Polyangia bacterium]